VRLVGSGYPPSDLTAKVKAAERSRSFRASCGREVEGEAKRGVDPGHPAAEFDPEAGLRVAAVGVRPWFERRCEMAVAVEDNAVAARRARFRARGRFRWLLAPLPAMRSTS